MTWAPPKHLAILNHSSAEPLDVLLWTEAVKQATRLCAKAWGIAPPGVFFYDDPPAGSAQLGIAVLAMVDDDNDPEAAGEHYVVGESAQGLVDLSQSPQPQETAVHEALEIELNPGLDAWVPGPGGLLYAREACDPFQGRRFPMRVVAAGVTADYMVADFALPAWFGAALGPTSYAESIGFLPRLEPFQIAPEGYQIAVDGDRVVYLGADSVVASKTAAALKANSRSAALVRKALASAASRNATPM